MPTKAFNGAGDEAVGKTEKIKGEVDKAAGGLVWREGPEGKKIVIVHRKRYDKEEWTLPKGHLQTKKDGIPEDEDWKDAALREVNEETECPKEDLQIEGIAGSISYLVGDKPKIVLFFNMTSKSDFDFNRKIEKKNEEVYEAKIVPVYEALAMLRHSKERSLVLDAIPLSDRKPSIIWPLLERKPVILGWLRKLFRSASHRRLDETIGPFEVELRHKITRLEEEKFADEKEMKAICKTAETTLQSVESAKRALSLGEIEIGWRYLFQADLTSIYLVEDEESRRIAALATLNEAEDKLGSWRKKTVQGLLGKDGELKTGITLEDIYIARKILQEHFTNNYIRLRTAQFQLLVLALIALVPIVSLAFLLPKVSGTVGFDNLPLLIAIMMLGAMGGAFSGIFSISRESGKGKIPDVILSSWLTIARPIVGIMAALAMSGFLLSGLIQLGPLTPPLILTLSFAVGFSERLLIKVIEQKSSGS